MACFPVGFPASVATPASRPGRNGFSLNRHWLSLPCISHLLQWWGNAQYEARLGARAHQAVLYTLPHHPVLWVLHSCFNPQGPGIPFGCLRAADATIATGICPLRQNTSTCSTNLPERSRQHLAGPNIPIFHPNIFCLTLQPD